MNPVSVWCMYCGKPTTSLSTKQCDNCWEVSTRISDMSVDVLRKMKPELGIAYPAARMDEIKPLMIEAARQVVFEWSEEEARYRIAEVTKREAEIEALVEAARQVLFDWSEEEADREVLGDCYRGLRAALEPFS